MTFLCKNGAKQLCSRQILGLSDFFYFKANGMGGLKEKIEFDYTDYSREAVKFFLDSMHMIETPETELTMILEVVDLAHSEGKTVLYDSFERNLSERLMSAVLESSFATGTELLIAAFLSQVDNMHEDYQRKSAKNLTREFCVHLYYDFDMSSKPNKQLIEMCVSKGIFDDTSRKTVLYTLTEFGQDLQRIYGLPSSFK